MCGIAGIVGRPGHDPGRSAEVRKMTSTLIHRGPDGEGYENLDGCDLGFRRLSIVAVDGRIPPYSNEDDSIWTICNGEIYNYQELRTRLEARGHRLRSHVDTEILPHLYEEYGPDCISQLDGMFAFALWDERKRLLLLGRDRAGEKPLFYWSGNGNFVFASEMRAILALPYVPKQLDPVALRRYLLHDFFPAPLTPIAGIRKLPAGHRLVMKDGKIDIARYWDLADHFLNNRGPGKDFEEAAEELDGYIARAVERRKRSDVPVGVFLSGGIDSSTLLAHLAKQEGEGIPVFSIRQVNPDFDETRYARQIAQHFKADYNELAIDERDLADGLLKVGQGFDEPLGDASTIPTHLLSCFARLKVKVVLSGEGGDELFAGYPTYLGHRIAGSLSWIRPGLRNAILKLTRSFLPVSMGNITFDYLLTRFMEGLDLSPIERHHSWFGSLSPERQERLLSQSLREMLRKDDPYGSGRDVIGGKKFPDTLSALLYTDFVMYLQDNLLTKVDRSSMLASLEARAPFLDHELSEYVAKLPANFKLRGATSKAILRKAVRQVLPPEILKRKKRGFNIPFSQWLLHGLGEKLRERFSDDRVRSRGLFQPAGVAELLDEHLSRKADHRKPIFTLLVFDLWCDRVFGEGQPAPVSSKGSALFAADGIVR